MIGMLGAPGSYFPALRRFVSLGVLAVLVHACNSDSQQLRQRAEARWREGNYEDAIRLNTLLYESDHQGEYAPAALLKIGDIYYLNLRKINEAIETYKRLASDFPGTPEEHKARLQLAAIYENEIKDLTQAIYEYGKILEDKNLDNRPEIQFRRANAYFMLEDYDSAWRELRHIEDAGVSGHLADQTFLKLGVIDQIRHQYEDAAGYFRRVCESPCPECRRRAILDLAKSYEALFDFDHAIETLGRLDPSPENSSLVRQEVARLKDKKRQADAVTVPTWNKHR
jgi:TolA-binding protein